MALHFDLVVDSVPEATTVVLEVERLHGRLLPALEERVEPAGGLRRDGVS